MRYRSRVAYHGANYKGWQIQPKEKTVQGELENALSRITQQEVRVHASGRTDTGVHAKAQMIHFDLINCEIPDKNLQAAINSYTAKDIAIYELEQCDESFHARYSEHQKTYHYHFDLNNPADPLNLDRKYAISYQKLEFNLMRAFINELQGTHDFASFCSIHNSSDTTIRTIPQAHISEIDSNNHFFLSITGKGFLQHMVRIIAGTMIEIGAKKIELQLAKDALKKPDMREQLGKTLPGHGLCLESILYL